MIRSEQELRRWKYGLSFLFFGIAILHFGLVIASAFPLSQHIATIIFHLVPILGFVLVGWLVLKVNNATTMMALIIATAIALVAGTVLGVVMQIAAMGPNEAELGVALYALLPLPLLLIELAAYPANFASSTFFLVFIPHIIAILLFGGYAFWMGRQGQSVREVVHCSLYMAAAILPFTLLAGVICKTILMPANFFSVQSAYIDWSSLFVAPVAQLLLYALLAGALGGWLGWFGRVVRPQEI